MTDDTGADRIRDYVRTAIVVDEAKLRKPDRSVIGSVIRDLVGLIS